jgi:metalloendopeptidase OMA1, mitochondrial
MLGQGGLAAVTLTLILGYTVYATSDVVPVTQRRRWIWTSHKAEHEMLEKAYRDILDVVQRAILPVNHSLTQSVYRVGRHIEAAAASAMLDSHQPVKSHDQTAALQQTETEPSSHYTYSVVVSRTIACFSCGRHIFITTGFIHLLRDGDELATILGHEMAHSLARHAAEDVSGERLRTAYWYLGLAFAVLYKRSFLGMLLVPVSELIVRRHAARRQEDEADRIGLHLATAAGFDPNAIIRFLKRLSKQELADGIDPLPLWELMVYLVLMSTLPASLTRDKNGNGGSTGNNALSFLLRRYPPHATRISNLEQWIALENAAASLPETSSQRAQDGP